MTNIKYTDIELTDWNFGKDAEDTDDGYFSLPRNICEKLFKEENFKPLNPDGKADDSWVEGDLQFIFNHETKELEEVLLFPVYDFEDSRVNGEDYISIDVDDNLISKAKEDLYAESESDDEDDEDDDE